MGLKTEKTSIFAFPKRLPKWAICWRTLPENKGNVVDLPSGGGKRSIDYARLYLGKCESAWIKRAATVRFLAPIDAIGWIESHRPKKASRSISFYIECLTFVNQDVKRKHRTFQTSAAAYQYLHFNGGGWLQKGADLKFTDEYQLAKWIYANKPEKEDNSLSYMILALSFVNPTVKQKHYSFARSASAFEYYNKPNGAWLRSGEKINFLNQRELILWLLANKPAEEKNSLSTLVVGMSFGNTSIISDLQCYKRAASAFTYLSKNAAARSELNRAFSCLNGSSEILTIPELHHEIDKAKLVQLINENKRLSYGYTRSVIETYLDFSDVFLDERSVIPV